MVTVSLNLIQSHLNEVKVEQMFRLLESDLEVQSTLRMSNVMAVERLKYNDHGPVHSKIASGSALEIFEHLTQEVTPTTVKNKICSLEDAKVIVLCGSYLHDLGNSIHRIDHHIHGCIIANPILDRLLKKVYPEDAALALRLKSEILHSIFSHEEEVGCLSVEAGAAKVADGTDMARGRARIPYRTGKVDIHSLSALSITKVEIEKGKNKPVQILVSMDNPAGVFQIEEVLERKLKTSGIQDLVDVIALERGIQIRRTDTC
uniref:Metal dependent phosphohydrolase n=1 Tax=uncultured miscellaneous Crenarchaeota group TaxID=1368239 RepID=W8RW61_9ARCH|nr:metal dependent phosphohydrolase [uncultured miscellaneous Crenarchaeota group]